MIETVMLVVLGFLAATLLALMVAPAFWARAVRLTSQRIRNTTPISEAEIRADKDLMRAEYAVKVHQLERQIEKSKLSAHRQFIEINRRDAAVTRLESELETLTADRDEHQNARRVLEQTVNDRLPKLEGRLEEARQLLRARDQAIGELNDSAIRQEASLEEARAINAQLAGEVERLKAYLADLGSRDRRRAAEPGVETEYALRTEIETLRARTREQAQVIASLQARLGGGDASVEAADEASADVTTLRVRLAEQVAEITRLESLVQTQGKAAEPVTEPVHAPTLMEKLRATEARLQRQTEETEQIRRELDLTRRGADADTDSVVRESKALLKARLERMTGELHRERDLTQRLKAELTAANERAARQLAMHMDEMRHLGARASTQRPAQANGGIAVRALRASTPDEPRSAGQQARPAQVLPALRAVSSVRVRELNKALSAGAVTNGGTAEVVPVAETSQPPSLAVVAETPAETSSGADTSASETTLTASEDEEQASERRGRLLARLKTYDE